MKFIKHFAIRIIRSTAAQHYVDILVNLHCQMPLEVYRCNSLKHKCHHPKCVSTQDNDLFRVSTFLPSTIVDPNAQPAKFIYEPVAFA